MPTMRIPGVLLASCLTLASITACSGKDSAKAGGDASAADEGGSSTKGGAIAGSGNGFRITMLTSRPSAAGDTGTARADTTTVRVLDGTARIDFSRGTSQGMTQGGWMLVEADGARMSIVDPKTKKVVVMDSLGALGAMAGMGGMMQMSVKDTSSRVEDLGTGETVLGYPTHKYRMSIGYTMEMTVMGRAMPMRTEQVVVVHMSDDAGLMGSGFEMFEKAFRSSMGGLTGNDAAAVIKALNSNRPKGFPLLQEMDSRIIRNGDTTTTRNNYRVVALARGVEPSELVIPADYAQTNMGGSMRDAMGKANEAMQKAGGAAERMRQAMERVEAGRPAAKP